jgi:hypothetical protein
LAPYDHSLDYGVGFALLILAFRLKLILVVKIVHCNS